MSEPLAFTVEPVSFIARGDVAIAGSLYVPIGGVEPMPAVSMTVGYGGVKEQGALPYAELFASAGFVVLFHDHRGFGKSEGLPRQDIDPWQQIEDWRRAISYLQSRAEVDPRRIGIWGSSYSGGHALVVAATDRRVRAAVSQVPTISGTEQARRRVRPEDLPALQARFDADEQTQLAGGDPERIAIVDADGATAAIYRDPEAVSFYLQEIPEGLWENTVTLRSLRLSRGYEPGAYVGFVSPTPLMMIVGDNDRVTPTDLALDAYERAREPKRLEIFDGGHFDAYVSRFSETSGAAVEWIAEHL